MDGGVSKKPGRMLRGFRFAVENLSPIVTDMASRCARMEHNACVYCLHHERVNWGWRTSGR